jgi:hypothetical protein
MKLSPMQGISVSISLGWQVMKSRIIEQLGRVEILLPSLVAEGLAANDRIKVRMSALQAATRRAQEPAHPATDLHVECREIERRVPWRASPQAAAVSSVRNCLCAQDDLEPGLRAFAEQHAVGDQH